MLTLVLERDGCFEMVNREGRLGLGPTKENYPSPRQTKKLNSTGEQVDFTTNFSFPSRDLRIKYYMGDWFNRTLQPNDIPCNEIHGREKVHDSDSAIMWNVGPLEKYVKSHKDWKTDAYLKDSLQVLAANISLAASDVDRRMILVLGDTHSKSNRLPAVAKTRFSRFAIPKKSGKPFFNTIIWPLSINRHHNPVDEYLKLKTEGKVCKWEDKKSSSIWRGGVTGILSDKLLVKNYPNGGWRIQVVKNYFHKNISDVDIAFKKGDGTLTWAPSKYKDVKGFVRDSHISMSDQLKYKYIVTMEGNDVATSLKWQLASNSVVFMARPICVSFAMEDLLVPFVHYVPLNDDYSNLIEMVKWARKNDAKCRWIAEQATQFMEKYWISEEAKKDYILIQQELGEIYHKQFGEAIKSCARK